MFTGIGGIIGVFGSAINRGINIYENKQVAKIEEKKRSDEYELAKMGAIKDTTVASYEHDKKLGENVSQWVANIRALVRPSITAYAFVFLTAIYFTSTIENKTAIVVLMCELLYTVVAWWFADRFKK